MHIYRNYLDPLSFSSTQVGSGNCRVTWKIPQGQHVIPDSIKIINLSFTCTASTITTADAVSSDGANCAVFNSTMGVYEACSYMRLNTGSGCEISECRNIPQLAQILNATGVTNDDVDAIKCVEVGNPVSMSINTLLQQQTVRHSMNNRLYINNGYYTMELNKFMPVLDALGEVVSCGFEVILEFNNTFANSPLTNIATIVLQYDEVKGYKMQKEAKKIVFQEWLPELQTVPAQTGTGQNTQSVRYLSWLGRSVNKMLFNVCDSAKNMPILLTNLQYNIYFDGNQFYPLTGLLGGAYQNSDVSRHMGGFAFPLNHLQQTNPAAVFDDPSVADVLRPGKNATSNNGFQYLAPIAIRLNGLKYKDLMVQLSELGTAPALNIWGFGLVNKIGVLTQGGDFDTAFV